MILSDAAIRNRITVGVLIVLIVCMGAFSYVTLPREAAPDDPIPFITVATFYSGVSPADYRNHFITEKAAVTYRAVRDALTRVLFFAGDAQLHRRAAG